MSVAEENFVAENWKYLIAALGLHVAIGVLSAITINSTATKVVPAQLAIKATLVDNSAQRLKREREAVVAKREEERQEQERVERERAEAEAQAREQAEQKQREEAETVKRVEQQRAEEKRQQVAVEQKKKADAQKAAATNAATKKAADDKKRVAEIKAKQDAKQRTEQDAREQAQREAELKRQIADEDGRVQAENSGMLSQWAALIEQRVVRNWTKPASARAGIQCDVRVNQAPGGIVLSVQIEKCNGDSAVQESIKAAVLRSSPLPPPPDARLFQRVIVFVFKPSE